MTFREATDRILGIIDLRDLARCLGVTHQLILKARMTTENRRRPPVGWEMAIRDLAAEKAAELREQAADLEDLVRQLDRLIGRR